ncbi:ATP-grasp domain-containing protein [Amycolatopsis panacis]|uniref:ATP-grasp domain-containing protein n=1 Tax=Amycolatopsis panacis TaxID=2340917 RepID=UPI0013143DE9|nr:ATP-grasp domain-containing protein [Amycolatopsis panacis]
MGIVLEGESAEVIPRAVSQVLAVGGGSDLQPRLRAMFPGLRTVALCRAAALGWVQKPGENQAVVVLNDDSPVERWIAAGRHINAEFPIDRIVAMADLDQDKAAAIAADLGVGFYSPEVVERVHNKVEMRRRLRERGVDRLPYRDLTSAAEARDFFAEAGPPLIVKPSRGRASAGVTVVTEPAQLDAAYHRAATEHAPRVEPSSPIGERFVEGPEYSVECLSHRGHHYVFAVNEEFKDSVSKVEYGHVVPARIDAEIETALVAYVRECLTALGIEHGITHSELIFGPDGPVFLETHLRQAGDEIPHLIADATGLDMADFFLRQVAGEDIGTLPELIARRDRPQYTAAAAIRYLVPPAEGVLEGIDGWDGVAALPGVRAHAQSAEAGAALNGLESSYSRLGHVRVRAADPAAALQLLDKAFAAITVRVRPAA